MSFRNPEVVIWSLECDLTIIIVVMICFVMLTSASAENHLHIIIVIIKFFVMLNAASAEKTALSASSSYNSSELRQADVNLSNSNFVRMIFLTLSKLAGYL